MLLIGFLLYGLGAILMILAYRHDDVSKLQPMLSFSYVLALGLGVFIFSETITIYRLLGTFSILIGVVIIGAKNE